MIRQISKQIMLLALINMSLFVPQFDLVPVNCAKEISNAIETHDKSVDSIATLIIESIFGVDVSFPIHEDAHFLEKDFVVKRILKGVSHITYRQTLFVESVLSSTKKIYIVSTDTIILSKFFGFLARLHYF